jgi:hypothetical protein
VLVNGGPFRAAEWPAPSRPFLRVDFAAPRSSPLLFRIRRGLTPAAAVGLLAIMAGATTVSLVRMGPVPAILPIVVGCLLVVIARGRSARWVGSSTTQPVASESARARVERHAA